MKQYNIEVTNNRYRPKYHFAPPAGWMNDPNGFIFHKGHYHLFYQHNPYAASWSTICWGHAISTDLVQWEHLPIALEPTESYEFKEGTDCGCASGTAVSRGEELVLFYTGTVLDGALVQVQCAASSLDETTFKKWQNPLICCPPAEGSAEFRDPKVWHHDGKWYMMVGTGRDGDGMVALYQSDALLNWEYIGIPFKSDGTQGSMWECPDLFSMDHHDVMLISPMFGKRNGSPFYLMGTLSYDSGVFEPVQTGLLDYGSDFYAPQVLQDDRGRTILIAWMDSWGARMPSQEDGWAGVMTLPRRISVRSDGRMIQEPIPELEALRGTEIDLGGMIVTDVTRVSSLNSAALEMYLEIQKSDVNASAMTFWVRCSEDLHEKTGIEINFKNMVITIKRTFSGAGDTSGSTAPFSWPDSGKIVLRVFVDCSSLEIFVNDGLAVLSTRIYPKATSIAYFAESDGDRVVLHRFQAWPINS